MIVSVAKVSFADFYPENLTELIDRTKRALLLVRMRHVMVLKMETL